MPLQVLICASRCAQYRTTAERESECAYAARGQLRAADVLHVRGPAREYGTSGARRFRATYHTTPPPNLDARAHHKTDKSKQSRRKRVQHLCSSQRQAKEAS